MTNSSDRKKEHIDLAIESLTTRRENDRRFYYEPILTIHPNKSTSLESFFLNKAFSAPIWVSSMTGGTGVAKHINQNLARACNEYGLGMGLGSCRKLLDGDEFLSDFQVRKEIGDQPLFANLGIAQINNLIKEKKYDVIKELLLKTEADGLIIHVNPTQEWLQPEGDVIEGPSPYHAIINILDNIDTKIIVKEVGQGMGPESLKALMSLPLAAIEFGAFGGTNFAKLENLRDPKTEILDPICFVGHSAIEMIDFINEIIESGEEINCREFIISGGVKDYLDGYYYNELLTANSIYGQAAGFLKYAQKSYEELSYHIDQQINGYKFANRYLSIK